MPQEFVTPPPVERGDTVAVVAPSAPPIPGSIEPAVRRLREHFDLEPVLYPSAEHEPVEHGELIDPEARAADVNAAFADEEITAIFAALGGDDQVRVTAHLDDEAVRANPTRFFGISDNTNLHAYLSSLGIVSYYGGQFVPGLALDTELPTYTREYLERALFEETLGELGAAEEYSEWRFDLETREPREWEPAPGWSWDVPGGDAAADDSAHVEPVTGRLWGGCVEVLEWVLAVDRGAPEPGDLEGGVLLLETSEELPTDHMVRRWLTNLGERGLVDGIRAILVGRPRTRHRGETPEAGREPYLQAQRDAIRQVRDLYCPEAPIVFDLDVGHTDPSAPLPIGGIVTVDPGAERIVFE